MKTSGYQSNLLGCTLILVITLTNVPAQVFHYAEQHAYLSLVLAGAALLLPLWIMSKAAAIDPEHSLMDLLVTRRPVLGKLVLGLYAIFFLLLLARDLRIMTDFTSIFLLQNTPLIVLSSLMMLPVIWMARGGADVISQMAEIFLPILIMVLILIPILGFRDIDGRMMMPIFDLNMQGIGLGWWLFLGYMGDLILLPFLIRGRAFRFRSGFNGLLLGMACLMIVVVFGLLILGAPMAARMSFPTYELVRHLQLTDFLDRFELIMVALYYPSTFVKLGISLHLLCRVFELTVPKLRDNLVAAPLGVFAIVCSLWFYDDLVMLIQINMYWPIIAIFFAFLLPGVIWLVLWSKREPLPR